MKSEERLKDIVADTFASLLLVVSEMDGEETLVGTLSDEASLHDRILWAQLEVSPVTDTTEGPFHHSLTCFSRSCIFAASILLP